jgi:hypothetical protein
MAVSLNVLENGIKRRSNWSDLRDGGVCRSALLGSAGGAYACSRLASGNALAALYGTRLRASAGNAGERSTRLGAAHL